MLGKFFYGQLSLREAFWKFSVLGLIVLGFISRLLMIQLKQSLNYEGNFINVAMRSLSFFRTEVSTMVYFAFYCASFLALVAYVILCIGGMWNTYKEYDKSKMLALICLLTTMVLSYFAIRFAIY